MKYKVGDKVRVRRDLVEDQAYGGCSFVENMTPLCNKIVTISRAHHEISSYQLTENLTEEYWTDEMLEDAEEEFKLPEKWHVKLTKENKKYTRKYNTQIRKSLGFLFELYQQKSPENFGTFLLYKFLSLQLRSSRY